MGELTLVDVFAVLLDCSASLTASFGTVLDGDELVSPGALLARETAFVIETRLVGETVVGFGGALVNILTVEVSDRPYPRSRRWLGKLYRCCPG